MRDAPFGHDEWALILGGSSGFGLATAHKLSEHGLNICIVHRDLRGAMSRIEPEFEAIRQRGVSLLTFNKDALNPARRAHILDDVAESFAAGGAAGPGQARGEGKIRLLLHSIAFGNLKLVSPEAPPSSDARAALARALGIDEEQLAGVADRLFEEGVDGVQGIASPPSYAQDAFLDDEDMVRTIYAMGTSFLTWTQDLLARGMFAPDARVLGMTSEGNELAWKGYAAVAAAKVALESVSRSIAVEMAHFGIRSNIIQAGVTDTPALRMIPGSDHLKAQARTRNPLGRLTTPQDVANVIYLLSLPEAAWINGAIIRVDGGEHISGLTG